MRLGDLVPELRARGRPCWRKAQHDSQGAADAHLRSLQKRGKLKNEQTANAYLCPHCGTWHVGHSSLKGNSE